MSARTFPDVPDFASDAERIVWGALREQLPTGAVVFANRRFTDRHGDAEADLIVAWPEVGIAVIEVKGGHVSLDRGGVWRQSGAGVERQVDPVGQAQRCRYALRDYLDGHAGWGRGHVRAWHLVAFPHSHVADDVQTTDCPRWMVVDRDQTAHVARLVRDALRGDGGGPRLPDADDVDAMVTCLVGRPQSQRELVAGQAEARAHRVDLLTATQATVLGLTRSMHRVEIRGGAGSGKTWLAVEQARRLTAAGQRVGLLAYSRGLSTYLRRRVDELDRNQRPAYTDTFHRLGLTWGAAPGRDDDSAYWEDRLPRQMAELAAALPLVQKFDAFVVDEGQDFSDSWWPALLAGLKDPVSGGLYVFADEGQRVFARTGRPPVDLAPIELDENLRNSKQIAQSFSSLVDHRQTIRGESGVPVRFEACSSDDALGRAEEVVDGLIDDGWASEHVALLTTGRRHPIQKERQEEGHDLYWQGFWATDDIFYGHVLGFKGLERPAVVLAVNGFGQGGEERAREKLYVGLSRARDLLVVCGDPDLVRRVGGGGVARRLGIE